MYGHKREGVGFGVESGLQTTSKVRLKEKCGCCRTGSFILFGQAVYAIKLSGERVHYRFKDWQ